MIPLNLCLKNDFEEKEKHNISYVLVVGSMMYAQVSVPLDIAYIVGMLGRYLRDLGLDYWKAKNES